MIARDVVVVGAGPAGATVACLLARAGRSVCIVDPRLAEAPAPAKPGEALPGAADRLLRAHGLPVPTGAGVHRAIGGNVSVWGGPEAVYRDFFSDPDGPGWRLDRRAFEAELVGTARLAGVDLYPGSVTGASREGGGWRVSLAGREPMAARWLIDASGRGARIARALGARRHRDEALVAVVGWGRPDSACRLNRTLVETSPEGWWYGALLPDGSPVFMLHTRPTDAARLLRAPAAWREALAATRLIAPAFPGARVEGPLRSFDASGGWLEPGWGEGWAACGDAAQCFDPAAAQGIFSALHAGVELAPAVEAALGGDTGPLRAYAARLTDIRQIYRSRINAQYALERRWPDAPFWRDRG